VSGLFYKTNKKTIKIVELLACKNLFNKNGKVQFLRTMSFEMVSTKCNARILFQMT